jgi:hypothetical protein
LPEERERGNILNKKAETRGFEIERGRAQSTTTTWHVLEEK